MAVNDKTVVVAPPADVAVGTQLSGTYELDARIASGGMGEVFRGHNIQTGDPVAIKIVLPEFARDAVILALFRKEASILNHLYHEAIVRYHVFAIDQAIGRPYLAMEFVDGLSLVELISRGPVPVQDARVLLSRIASGLAAAHEAGVIHRDLSPDNIILPGGQVARAKIIDFGIARSASVGGETLLGGAFAGKYNFVSPEQLGLFGGEVTERSDIYSLGLVMAAVLRGQALDMTGSQVAVIEKRRAVPDLSAVDPDLRPILEAMLQPNPSDRPQGMADIAHWSRPALDDKQRSEQESTFARFETQRAIAADATKPPAQPHAAEPQAATRAPRQVLATSESPFGPYTGPAEIVLPAASATSQIPPQAARGRNGYAIGISALVVLAALGAGGAWYGGLIGAGTPSGGEVVGKSDPKAPDKESEVTRQDTSADTRQTTITTDVKTPMTDEKANDDGKDAIGQATQDENKASADQKASDEKSVEVAIRPDTLKLPPPTVGPKILDEVATRIDWLKDYSGGACFFATAISASGPKTEIEGFGSNIEGFQKLLKDFSGRFGAEPDIGVRLIREKQCPVTDFLNGLRRASGDTPTLTLVKYELADRDPMSGELQLQPARQTYLLLIDHDGIAHNLDSILKKSGERAEFNIAVGLGADRQADKGPIPQVLLAITTSSPLLAMRNSAAVPSSQLLPQLLAEIETGKMEAAATARYFRIRGS